MRRIRLTVVTVMVAAGLVGAVAAPASADPPLWSFSAGCDVNGIPQQTLGNGFTRRDANQIVNNFLSARDCDKGTKFKDFVRL
jgi:hypothetical protein